MSNIREAQKTLLKRILEGAGEASLADRRAAFNNTGLSGAVATLVEKVAMQPSRVTDDDINGAVMSGFTEDQVFEIVVCAAIGQATRQYEAAVAALEAAAGGSEHAPSNPR